jgi:hypothetical protein
MAALSFNSLEKMGLTNFLMLVPLTLIIPSADVPGGVAIAHIASLFIY